MSLGDDTWRNLGRQDATEATVVNPTTSGISYLKGIFQHLLTNLSITRMAKIDTIASSNAISYGAVKSVQRGTKVQAPGGTTITISSVNPLKSIVTLNGVSGYDNQTGTLRQLILPYIESVTSTSIVVKGTDVFSSTFSWQIIEFY